MLPLAFQVPEKVLVIPETVKISVKVLLEVKTIVPLASPETDTVFPLTVSVERVQVPTIALLLLPLGLGQPLSRAKKARTPKVRTNRFLICVYSWPKSNKKR